jgi:peptidoglycan hydrolase-like protein with peptidoglycan-binding domain
MAREPASIRYKNPGAMWGNKLAVKWGAAKAAVKLNDGTGQGNNIAVFPTYVAGICAQLDLWRTSKHYRNKKFKDAIAIWSGGNHVQEYIAFVKKRVPGMTENTVMNDAFWQSDMGIAFLKAQAWHEAGKRYPAPAADWIEAQRIVFSGAKPKAAAAGAQLANPPIAATTAAPVTSDRPGVWSTLWRAVRGKDATVATTAEKSRPGLHANGDPALYDQQATLSDKGYVEVGQPDGLLGWRTAAAVRAFRAENGLPTGDEIDPAFGAALAAAGPRQVARARVEATASDLRQSGNSQVATLDGFKAFGWILGLLGVGGGVEQSGLLNKATDTLQSAQDTLGTVTTIATTIIGIAQWCFAHWWMFALGGGVYLIFRVAMAILNMVVLFRQGFLARADK